MTIRATIADVTARLKWIVTYQHGGRDLEITSDPWTRTHTIKIPTEGPDWRDIEYLHELAHATLAEKHHLLATGWFVRGTDQAAIAALTNPARVAGDWFADDLLMRWCQDAETAEIREHAGYAMGYSGTDPIMIYGGGLFLGQAVHYLGDKIHTVPRRYRPVVDVLLATDPGKPTVSAKRDLINSLATLTCPYRVRMVRDGDVDVWKAERRK